MLRKIVLLSVGSLLMLPESIIVQRFNVVVVVVAEAVFIVLSG